LPGHVKKRKGIMKSIITVDGPAGSGKSTVSRLLAKQLGYLYLDTGAMYRAVALRWAREGLGSPDEAALKRICKGLDLQFRLERGENRLYLGDEDVSAAIRSPEMDRYSSILSTLKQVREAMTELQRKVGSKGRVVAEGRDMGTVVFPGAEFKFFLTADLEVRAERRYRERITRGEPVNLKHVEREMMKRDEQDMNRVLSPLRPAEDAITIDTSRLNPDQVMDAMLEEIGKGCSKAKDFA
jgi:CMP/dCMP kinase